MEQFKQTATICSPQYPAFDYEKFAAGWQKRHLNMLFPEPGVLLQDTTGDGFSKTLSQWDSEFPEICEGHWEQYICEVFARCGSWDKRCNLPLGEGLPAEPQMVAGVLQLDRKYLQAAIKKLYGVSIKPSTLIAYGQLVMSGYALFNRDPVFASDLIHWAKYVEELNRQHQLKKAAEQRRESQIRELLQVFDEGQE